MPKEQIALGERGYNLLPLIALDGSSTGRAALAHAKAIGKAYSASEDERAALIAKYAAQKQELTSVWAIQLLAYWHRPDAAQILWQISKDLKRPAAQLLALDVALLRVDEAGWRNSPSRLALLHQLCSMRLTPDEALDVQAYLTVISHHADQVSIKVPLTTVTSLLLDLLHNPTARLKDRPSMCAFPGGLVHYKMLPPTDAINFWAAIVADPTQRDIAALAAECIESVKPLEIPQRQQVEALLAQCEAALKAAKSLAEAQVLNAVILKLKSALL